MGRLSGWKARQRRATRNTAANWEESKSGQPIRRGSAKARREGEGEREGEEAAARAASACKGVQPQEHRKRFLRVQPLSSSSGVATIDSIRAHTLPRVGA